MMGSMLAGCDESPGAFELYQGRKYQGLPWYGFHRGDGERQQGSLLPGDAKKLVPEGVEGRVAYKGSVEDTIFQLLGGLRAGMGYCGASDIPTLTGDRTFHQDFRCILKGESSPRYSYHQRGTELQRGRINTLKTR